MTINKQRPGSGILFRNTRKTEDGPDYVGECNIDGTEFLLSGWVKEGQKTKFLSLSIRPKTDDAVKPQRTYASAVMILRMFRFEGVS